jgi:hypothetical protein
VGHVHYHFKTKDNFLRRSCLQQVYEEIFTGLAKAAQRPGPALDALRGALALRPALLARTAR